MKIVLVVAGILLIAVGGLWILQGLGYVGGSFMSGAKQWFWIGLVVALAGVALAGWGALSARRGGDRR
ncbi:MAG: hypothetical protein HOY71_56510 [Nonomuraea sp.]|nr:hypothetical protein [Nonomuraea sp.]